jgi:signal transduction histidine kinase
LLSLGDILVNPWILVILVSVTLNLVVAGLALGVSSAPGWRDQRALAVIAVAAATFGFGDLHTCLAPLPVSLRQASAGFGLVGVSTLLAGWILYAARVRGGRLDRLDRALLVVPLITGLLSLVPGLAFSERVLSRQTPGTDLLFWDVAPNPAASLCFGLYLLVLTVLIVRQVRDMRRGVPFARYLMLALLLSGVAGFHDMLVSWSLLNSVYLAEVGLVAGVFTLGLGLSRRFLASAVELEGLTRSLEVRVAERTVELERTAQALARAERLGAVGQLAAGVAHEINNPASAILANLEYLKQALPATEDAELRAAMGDATASIKRITRIVRQLLDLSRAAARGVPANAVARLRDVISASVETARATCSADANLQLEVTVTDNLWVRADRYLLEQVLTNLVVNAIQATREGEAGHVTISASSNEDLTTVKVVDRGVGMSRELRERIGEPFFSTKPAGQGTGLGLAVSFGLVKNLGGTLSFESELGVGTTASLALPTAAEAASERSSIRISTSGHQTLLLVDDDAVVLRSLTRTLSPLFRVTPVDSIGAARDQLAATDFDLIVCDVMMPDGGAQSLYAWLSRERPEQALVTIFLTGGAASQGARDFLAQSHRPVLIKPFSINELVQIGREFSARGTVAAEE